MRLPPGRRGGVDLRIGAVVGGGGIGRYVQELVTRWLPDPRVASIRLLGHPERLDGWLWNFVSGFETDRAVYLYRTVDEAGLENRVERYVLAGGTLYNGVRAQDLSEEGAGRIGVEILEIVAVEDNVEVGRERLVDHLGHSIEPGRIDRVVGPGGGGQGHGYTGVQAAKHGKGRDDKATLTEYSVTSFEPTDYDQDIVWADGFFVRWPQKP